MSEGDRKVHRVNWSTYITRQHRSLFFTLEIKHNPLLRSVTEYHEAMSILRHRRIDILSPEQHPYLADVLLCLSLEV
jgi:hypothetical protein